ncbi:hypothetical protein D3C72_2158780 [compost metagenome]
MPALDAQLADVVDDALGQVQRLVQPQPRQQQAEFLAADAAGDIAFAQHFFQRVAQRGQHQIAGVVAVAIVDLLEVVEVQHQYR